MLFRLPYRLQVPLGLSMAVVTAAVLVMVVAAQISARGVRQETLATVDSAIALLGVQARPLLATDDTWRVYTLLRNTAALLPGADTHLARAALLDADGLIVAASDPSRLPTGTDGLTGKATHSAQGLRALKLRFSQQRADGSITIIDPVTSEDGQVLGFSYVELDGPVFRPDWAAVAQPAAIGALLAVALLAPMGWIVGNRMGRPIARVAECISRIGHADSRSLAEGLPTDADPELHRISSAVRQLLREMEERKQAERRALSAERMAALGRITAAVAHEINNPLAGLLTATQTLRLHGDSAATRTRTLDLIERGLQQIRTTVAAVVPQARLEDRPLTLDDLDDVVALVRGVALRAGVGVSSQADVHSALRVPSSAVRQAMLNLLLNAVKAAGETGWVRATLAGDADRVAFTVANSGQRLTSGALEQSIAAESGNDPRGFGLWVCREIASQFGGSFEAIDAAEGGTELVFEIPNRERDAVTAAG